MLHERAGKSVWNMGIYEAVYLPASSVTGFQSLLLNGTEGNKKLNHSIYIVRKRKNKCKVGVSLVSFHMH